MQEPGLSKARRAWTATLLVGLVLLVGYGCVCFWPVTTTAVNPFQTPFYGPHRANGFVHPEIHDTQGQRRAHKLIVAAAVLLALVGSFRWWEVAPAQRAFRFIAGLWPKRARARRLMGGLVILVLLAVILAKEIPSLDKTPDFSGGTPASMALLNNHIGMTLGHADRLAAGDVLFRDTTPEYGVLFPVLLAVYERYCGLIALGDHMRLMVLVEVIYWMIAGYLFLIWSRGNWMSCVLPVLLLLQFYWSATNGLVPPNHSPYRTAGMTLAMLSLMVLRNASARTNQWAAGLISGLAILANIESGIAASVGTVIYVIRRYGLVSRPQRGRPLVRAAARFLGGLGLAVTGFVFLYRAGCGSWPYLPGLRDYFIYARLSSTGYGTKPFQLANYADTWHAIWPFIMFAHVIWSIFYSAQQRTGGFRSSYRIAVGVTLLVWFAYFVNRPDPEYIGSYLLLYGLYLIDLWRHVRLAFSRPRLCLKPQWVTAVLVLFVAGMMASRVVAWSWKPSEWAIKTMRSAVPLVGRGDTRPAAPRVSKAYLPKAYVGPLRDRAEYLRSVAHGHRLIYFTVDSYLMPRLSGVLPLQQFADPIEALTRTTYDRLLNSILKASVDRVYVDSRNASELIWYGGMFDLLRRDLSRRFERVSIEHGWEVWRRRPEVALENRAVSRAH